MKRFYSPWYFISQAFKGIFRNGVMSFASVAVLMSCLVVLGAFSLLVMNIDVNLEQIGLLNEIVVFVERDATEEQIQEIESRIRALDNVDTVKRVTKEEALQGMIEDSPDYAYLYEDIGPDENPLSDSFQITYRDNDEVVTLAYLLSKIEGIRRVNNRLDLAVTISNFKSGVTMIFMWFLIVLGVVSIFVIINTIKLSVFSRREEIEIMRYVGATGWFIVLPFIIEGTLIGLFSGTVAFFAERYFYLLVERMASRDLQMLTLVSFQTIQTNVLIAFIAIGVLAGIIGSSISLGKYVKV